MSSGSYRQSEVKCPFYKFDDGKHSIHCEGIIPGTKVCNYFYRRLDFHVQFDGYCCDAYDECELAAALQKKYEEDTP